MSRPSTAQPARRRVRAVLGVVLAVLATSAAWGVAHAATPPHAPFGYLDRVQQIPGGLSVAGWALDPDTAAPIHVDLYIDGRPIRRLLANGSRPDVGARYRKGNNHGFGTQVTPVPAGTHSVCVFGINAGAGRVNTLIRCVRLTLNYNPFGRLTGLQQQPGGLTFSGWTLDPDSPRTSLVVRASVDGTPLAPRTANLPRSDVARAYPSAGPAHGFSFTTPAAQGRHVVCVTAGNVMFGQDASLSCAAIVLNFSPSGGLNSLTQVPGAVRLTGWASDPDTPAPIDVTVLLDGRAVRSAPASSAVAGHQGHGFDLTVAAAQGAHTVCVRATNVGLGSDVVVGCRAIALNFNPSVRLAGLAQRSPGFVVTGWAVDPDTNAPIRVTITADGTARTTVLANGPAGPKRGHAFAASVPLGNGRHTICAIGINTGFGSGNSAPACAVVSLNFNPYGALQSVGRAANSTNLRLAGWAIDPDTTAPISVVAFVDGRPTATIAANIARADIARSRPGTGAAHGFAVTVTANANEHRVCAIAVNVGGGSGNTLLGCTIINAVHPVVPSAPRAVGVIGGYGGATVTWQAPTSDGGAPWSSYTVTASPGGVSATVGRGALTTTVVGLKPKTTYTFAVQASNVAGRSRAAVSQPVATQASPPPQTSPAPISTSRYIRNISGSSPRDLATMRAEGAADARANPSGHGYLILLAVGGQDQTYGGVVLSATTRFVAYGDLVRDLNAYVDGYASQQKASAPVTIAIGTNNDMDVSAASGAAFARTVVNPVRAHSAAYSGVTIAGANDIEPGFRGTYAQSRAWLGGYLAATPAPFVFTGSADGCAWTLTNSRCNNGWTMAGLYYLSGGAAPVRIINLPQIYNPAMAAQWKYISLTGVRARQPKIDFGGALTEWTACAQTGSCGSLTGNNAWDQMWSQLRSTRLLLPSSLPYSTDLRVDS